MVNINSLKDEKKLNSQETLYRKFINKKVLYKIRTHSTYSIEVSERNSPYVWYLYNCFENITTKYKDTYNKIIKTKTFIDSKEETRKRIIKNIQRTKHDIKILTDCLKQYKKQLEDFK